MERWRQFYTLIGGEPSAVQCSKFGTQLLNAHAQTVSIALVILLVNQPRKQGLGVLKCGRQFGQPASAAGGLGSEVTVHEALFRVFRLLARIDKIHIGGFSD